MPKSHLVRLPVEYRKIFRCGEKKTFAMFNIYTHRKENGPTRLGLVVSRKVGGAFLRNKYKRVIREFFRLNYLNFPLHTDIIVILKPCIARYDIYQFRAELHNMLGLFKDAEKDSC